MKKNVSSDDSSDIFELTDSDVILNLEFYLHRSIVKWQDALEIALRQGENISSGLTNRGLAGDMVEGIAKAKGLIHWEKQDVPEKEGKHRNNIIRLNEQAESFQSRFKEFKKSLEGSEIDNAIKKVKISDFKVYEVLNTISKSSTKRGTIIV